MSSYVMSDLHGDWIHFRLMLCRIGFSSRDTLYLLGDVVDRGPHGIRLLRYTMKHDNIVLLLGNHELMLLEGLEQSHTVGQLDPAWFDAATYTELCALSISEREEIRTYLPSLPLIMTVSVCDQSYQLVHACPPSKQMTRQQALETMLWSRVDPAATFSQQVIAGHTPTAYYQECCPLRIWHNGNFMDIDCGTAFRSIVPGGCLACLRLNDGKEFYI